MIKQFVTNFILFVQSKTYIWKWILFIDDNQNLSYKTFYFEPVAFIRGDHFINGPEEGVEAKLIIRFENKTLRSFRNL